MRSTPLLTSASAISRAPVTGRSGIDDGRHPERRLLAVLVGDADVFAEHEGVTGEAITGFILVVALNVEAKGPRAARPVEDVADLLLTVPETDDAAFVAILLPAFGVEVTVGGERRGEAIVVLVAALGVAGGAGEIKPHGLQVAGRHGRSEFCLGWG